MHIKWRWDHLLSHRRGRSWRGSWCRRRCLHAQPLRFNEVFEQLRNRTATLDRELVGISPNLGVDG